MHAPVPIGTVMALAIRPKRGEALEVVEQVDVKVGAGIVQGGRKVSEKRGITLLASQQWAVVQQDLKSAHLGIPWTARRANVLLDVAPLADLGLSIPPSVKPPLPDRQNPAITDPYTLLGLIGRQIKIGTALLEVTVETKPCSHIDRLTPGLRKALLSDGRGGVCCRVIEDGQIIVGNQATLLP